MTSFLKCTGAAQEQSAVVLLPQAHEQLVGDGGSYHCKIGFKDLRQRPTKYSTSTHAKGPFVVEQASRLLKNNRPTTRCLGHRTEVQVRGAMGLIQPANETGKQGLAHTIVSKVVDFRRRSCRSGVSPDIEGLTHAGETPALLFRCPTKIKFQPSVPILEKSKARQGSRRAKKTPRMAKTMN
jgi:hypothetical protein